VDAAKLAAFYRQIARQTRATGQQDGVESTAEILGRQPHANMDAGVEADTLCL
jgi:hypothetical protein